MRTAESRCRGRRGGLKGLTLVEVLVAVPLVGIAFAALMTAVASSTELTMAASNLTQAVFLVQEVRERTMALPFADLANVTYSPPRNALGQEISSLPNWSQVVTLGWRAPSDLSAEVAAGASDIVLVRVTIRQGSEDVFTTSWLIVQKE